MDSFLATTLRSALIPIAIAGSMALFHKLLPASKGKGGTAKLNIEKLDEEFLPLRWKVWTVMSLVGIAFAVVSYFLLKSFNQLLAAFDGPATFRFFPESAIWWFFPGFGCLSLCWELTLQIWAIFAGRDFVNLFSDWSNISTRFWGGGGRYAGIDSRKVMRWLTLVITFPIGVLTALALNMHAAMNPSGIMECGYAFRPCSTHPYDSIRRMAQIQGKYNDKEQWIDAPAVILDFSDGSRWSSTSWGGIQKSINPALPKFLEDQTHRNFEHYLTEADIPTLAK